MKDKGWPHVKLGNPEYFKVIMGQSPPSSSYNDCQKGLPFFQGKADFGVLFPTPRKYCVTPIRIAEKNDVLISVRAPVGPTNMADQKYCIGRGLAAIRCKDKVTPRFLLYALRNIKSAIAESVKDQGGGFTAIKKDQIKAFEIPIPPLDEQRRIVARIEELTRRAEEVWRLRMAVAQEVSQMFQVEMKRIFSPQEMDDWVAYESRYVFDIVRGQVDPMDPPYRDLPHVAPDCVESGTGRLLLNRVKTPRELCLASGKYHFKTKQVLYSKIRPNLRKVALPSFEGTCSADMYSLIPNIELVTREFLALALLSPPFTQYAVENSDRNAMPKINRSKLFAYKMKLPRKELQEEITARIREIQAKADEIHALQVQNEGDMAKFQPALLAKAFRGEL